MKRLLLTSALVLLLSVRPATASEEFDPALYPQAAEAELMTDGVDNVYGASTMPVSGSALIASPKFVSDEDLNFDDLVDGETADEGEDIELDEPPVLVGTPSVQQTQIPMIQKAPDKSAETTKEDKKEDEKTAPKIDKDQTLTDTISESKEEKGGLKLPGVDTTGTWINKIKSPIGGDKDKNEKENKTENKKADSSLSLETMVQKSKKAKKRSNASVFDISGAMLRMTFQQIDDTLSRRGYRKTVQKMDIPNFIRWRNEDKCRASGVVGYERLANCVVKMAKQDKHEFVETAAYAKYDTKENIEVRFTSNFTNNKAYKISYKSEALNIGGNSPKMMYLRNIKIYDFWKKINQKYGAPDNRDDVMWGLGGNKPYMQAGTGRLILEDPMLRELDYTRMSREDQRFMNTDLYSF
ncbi:MAG: hypothetical protein ACI4OW_06935 [Alphaproteobacteria bacterium]